MALMGLDIGSTGCKATVFAESGEFLSNAYQEYAIVNPAPGVFELDPLTVWAAVQNVIRKAAGPRGRGPGEGHLHLFTG